MILGWGAAVSLVLSWVDKLIPSKKAALVQELTALNVKYQAALLAGRDTEAAILRKQMEELRKKVTFTEGDL
jgi:hypothetical protein